MSTLIAYWKGSTKRRLLRGLAGLAACLAPMVWLALNPGAAAGCIGMRAPTEPHARLSLNLAALLGSRLVYILLLGAAKLDTFTTASGPGPVEDMPVRAVLRQDRTPVEVVWAP